MEKLTYSPPQSSPAHVSLRSAVSAAGFDELALRRLLWLINAHPLLIAHAKVFKHIGHHLASAGFQADNLTWAGGWTNDIHAWKSVCDWIWKNRAVLSRKPGLDKLNLQPASENNHPQMGKGVVRHPIPAALWNVHGSLSEYPPVAEEESAASGYFALQGHVLAVYIEARFRMSDLEFYESYSAPLEMPIAPMRTSAISLAVRDFSLPQFSGLLAQMPLAEDTRKFAKAFIVASFSRETISEEGRGRAFLCQQALRRYFNKFLLMLTGWRPNQNTRKGWGASGGHARRPGFVHFDEAPGVYLEEPQKKQGDKDIPRMIGQRVFIDLDPEEDGKSLDTEQSGLAPGESLDAAFNLIDADELRGRVLALRQQRLAIEMQAQAMPFNYSNLTPQELGFIWEISDKRILRYIRTVTASDDVWHAALAGLMVKLSLCFGQSLNSVKSFEIAWQAGQTTGAQASIGDGGAALIFSAPAKSDWEHAVLVGLRLPGIMPNYKTELPDELEDLDREYAANFVLPDLFGLGEQMVQCFRIHPPPEGRAFGIQIASMKCALADLLKETRNERITPEKIAATLPSLVTSLSGDQSLAWVLCADWSMANEPRMHYTRHSLKKLNDTYWRAARHLAKSIGVRINPSEPGMTSDAFGSVSTGARFVIDHNELREIIANLSGELKDRDIDRVNPEQQIRYHNRYMLYTILYQTLATSMRITIRPTELYDCWLRLGAGRDGFIASISDKGQFMYDKSRLVWIPAALAQQFGNFRLHENHVANTRGIWLNARTSGQSNRPFYYLNSGRELEPVGPGWVASALRDLTGYDIPSNFARAYLRTELLQRGCAAVSADTLISHANKGELVFATYSTFDFKHHLEYVGRYLNDIHAEIGLHPIESRFVPYADRVKRP